MSGNSDQTFTGGIGYPANHDETLTRQIGARHQENETLTRDCRVPAAPQPSDVTAQGIETGKKADGSRWKIGDMIDNRYEVKGMIGQGGMGTVYRVRHREWNIEMAVKMPLAGLVADEASKARFVREAQTWVDLGLHPNIVQCWYVQESGGIPRVFMDYLKGGSLKDRIREHEIDPDDGESILDLMIQACDGLVYAHEKGLVHRDVKPGNLLMTEKKRLCVTDFGLVKVAGAADIEDQGEIRRLSDINSCEDCDLTITGSLLGTPEYGAPEQWAGARHVDTRADIYALGVVVFELFCGRRPFDDGMHREPPQVLIGRHLSQPPPDPREFNRNLHPGIAALMLRCLAKKPEERPASMNALREELAEIYGIITGKKYFRPVPAAANLRADSLNNKAVSLWDLGKKTEAFAAFRKALAFDPQHLEANKNLSVLYWNEAKFTDIPVLERLYALKKIHCERAEYWREIGEIHLCRGAMSEAAAALEKARALEPIDEESRRLDKYAREAMSQDIGWARNTRTFEGHAGAVNCCGISPDGKICVSGSSDNTLRLWETASGKCLSVLGEGLEISNDSDEAHSGGITCVAISPCGTYCVSGSLDNTLRLWELRSGKCLHVFREYTDIISCCAISPDGKFCVSGSLDKSLWLWDLNTKEHLRSFEGHSDSVYAVVFYPDGKHILSGSWDRSLRLWESDSGKCLHTFTESMDAVECATVSPDGKFCIAGCSDNMLYLWDTASGKCRRVFQGHTDAVSACAVTPDSRFCISGSSDMTLRLWDSASGKCLRTFEGHEDAVTAVAVSPDGKCCISGSLDNSLKLWHIHFQSMMPVMELARIKELGTLKQEQEQVRALAEQTEQCLTEGKIADALERIRKARRIPGFERDTELLRLWNRIGEKAARSGFRTGWLVRMFEGHSEPVTSLAVTPDKKFLLTAAGERILLWESETGKYLRAFEGHIGDVNVLALSSDSRFVFSGSSDNSLRLWEISSGTCLHIFAGHTDGVNAAALSADRGFGLSGSGDHTVRVWELSTGRCLRVLKKHSDSVNAVAISSDRRFGLSGSSDNTLRLWELASGRCLRTFKGHTDAVNAVMFTPDGKFGLSGSSDNTLRLWKFSTGKCLRIFEGHAGSVNAAVITGDGKFVFSGNDRAVILWELATGRELCMFDGHAEPVTSLDVTSDSRFIFSGSSDTMLLMWEADWEFQPCADTPVQLCKQKSYRLRDSRALHLALSFFSDASDAFAYIAEKISAVMSNFKPLCIIGGILLFLYALNSLLNYMK